MRVVRSLLGECEVFDRVGVVRRMLGEMIRYSIELRVVSLLEDSEVFDRVESCKENVRRNVRYLIELKENVVRI